MRRLCRLDDLAPGVSRHFGPAPGGFTGLFAVRHADDTHLYVNACPISVSPSTAFPVSSLPAAG